MGSKMNERIRELAEQAGMAEAADVRGGYIYPPGMEKFAELIIQECLGLLGSECEYGKSHIKQHFGVES